MEKPGLATSAADEDGGVDEKKEPSTGLDEEVGVRVTLAAGRDEDMAWGVPGRLQFGLAPRAAASRIEAGGRGGEPRGWKPKRARARAWAFGVGLRGHGDNQPRGGGCGRDGWLIDPRAAVGRPKRALGYCSASSSPSNSPMLHSLHPSRAPDARLSLPTQVVHWSSVLGLCLERSTAGERGGGATLGR